jgi:nucleoside-diphosphate-sugar epimerase
LRVGVIGAAGFVGRTLIDAIYAAGHAAIPIVRRPSGIRGEITVGDLTATNAPLINDVQLDAVVHLVAKTHTKTAASNEHSEYFRTNVGSTAWALAQARASGARKFVYLSSVKVNGEETSLGHPFTEMDSPAPEDAYGASKYDAENLVLQKAREFGLRAVIVRSPLIYGIGAKGNFPSLARIAGLPLPFGAINNRRSVVYVENLCSALLACLVVEMPDRQVFLVSDGEAVSTASLIRQMASAQGKKDHLFSVRPSLLVDAARMLGKYTVARRLCASLEINDDLIRSKLGWVPPFTTTEGLIKTFR